MATTSGPECPHQHHHGKRQASIRGGAPMSLSDFTLAYLGALGSPVPADQLAAALSTPGRPVHLDALDAVARALPGCLAREAHSGLVYRRRPTCMWSAASRPLNAELVLVLLRATGGSATVEDLAAAACPTGSSPAAVAGVGRRLAEVMQRAAARGLVTADTATQPQRFTAAGPAPGVPGPASLANFHDSAISAGTVVEIVAAAHPVPITAREITEAFGPYEVHRYRHVTAVLSRLVSATAVTRIRGQYRVTYRLADTGASDVLAEQLADLDQQLADCAAEQAALTEHLEQIRRQLAEAADRAAAVHRRRATLLRAADDTIPTPKGRTRPTRPAPRE